MRTVIYSLLKLYSPRLVRRFLAPVRDTVAVNVYKRRNVGRGAMLDRSVHVLGWRTVRIGSNTIISEETWLNVNDRSAANSQIKIGVNTYIGRRNLLSSGNGIFIGDYCITGVGCSFLGSDHIINNPFLPYISTGTTKRSTIQIGSNCWLGANVAVLGNVLIGHGSVVGANSLVKSDLPPFCIAVGSPARVVKRFDVISKTWVSVADFTDEMEAALPDEAAYLRVLEAAKPELSMPRKAAGRSQGHLP